MKNFTKRMRNSRISQTRKTSEKWKEGEKKNNRNLNSDTVKKQDENLLVSSLNETLISVAKKQAKSKINSNDKERLKGKEIEPGKKQQKQLKKISVTRREKKSKLQIRKPKPKLMVREETHSTGNFFVER
jgi:hypothetical protein